ncbi:MAG: hypothetical protein N2554_08185 [Fimbriimonadales bacterium]|nr:hypothetical protein [Fimbriimonadales bacterium]
MRRLGWIVGMCLCWNVWAQETIYAIRALEKPVSVRHEQIALGELVRGISDQTGVALRVSERVADWKVTIRVNSRPAWQVLEKIAAIYDLVWRPDDTGALTLQADSYVQRQLQQAMSSQPVLDALLQQLAQHAQRAAETPFKDAVERSRALLREYAPDTSAPRSESLKARLRQHDLIDYLLQDAHKHLSHAQLERLAQGKPLLFSAKPLPNTLPLGESTLEYVRIAFQEGILGVPEAHPDFQPTNWVYVLDLCAAPGGLLFVTDGARVLTYPTTRSRPAVRLVAAPSEPRNPCWDLGEARRALQAQGYLGGEDLFARHAQTVLTNPLRSPKLKETPIPQEANSFVYNPDLRVSQYLFWLAEQTDSDLIADAYHLSMRGASRARDYRGVPYQVIPLTPQIRASVSAPLGMQFSPASFDAELLRFLAGSGLSSKYEDNFLMFRHEECWRLLTTELSDAQRAALQSGATGGWTLDAFAQFVETLTPAQRRRWETLGYGAFSDSGALPKDGLAALRFWAALSDAQRARARQGEPIHAAELTPAQAARLESVIDDLLAQHLQLLWQTHAQYLPSRAREVGRLLLEPAGNALEFRYRETREGGLQTAVLEFRRGTQLLGAYAYRWRGQDSTR